MPTTPQWGNLGAFLEGAWTPPYTMTSPGCDTITSMKPALCIPEPAAWHSGMHGPHLQTVIYKGTFLSNRSRQAAVGETMPELQTARSGMRVTLLWPPSLQLFHRPHAARSTGEGFFNMAEERGSSCGRCRGWGSQYWPGCWQ